jgi:UDP-N-acetylmuramate dehydrogenase
MEQNVSLKPFNTFGLEAKAQHFLEINNQEELIDFLTNNPLAKGPLLPIGGGSNILLTQDYKGTVLKLSLKGKHILKEQDNYTFVEVAGGENWHDFVLWSISENLGGIENMSLIPGNVGTAPIQNIGAYGVEQKDSFVSLTAVEIETGQIHHFTDEACEFGYRDSVFKRHLKGKFIITKVVFKLTNTNHVLKTSYGAIQNQLQLMNVLEPTIKEVSDAVIAIRQSKLPDPKEIGNSGSFFKNPVISNEKFEILKHKFPEVSAYPNGENHTKVAAGWLIEQAGLKGLRRGPIGVHEKQALVLVNYGGGKGKDIQQLSSDIQAKVKEIFDISLEAEVNIL